MLKTRKSFLLLIALLLIGLIPINTSEAHSILVETEDNSEKMDKQQNDTVEGSKDETADEQKNEQSSLTTWIIIAFIIAGIVLLDWNDF
ncbi:hypothetical protein [Virgibacillus dakarensis]|uniref:hypothetical protein n=1 Tax=Virgibacillus dakarensis TaxID=1917889 RepID=UPI000B4503FF|nr:hypothetical protein [Virgibacillus dakarensis]